MKVANTAQNYSEEFAGSKTGHGRGGGGGGWKSKRYNGETVVLELHTTLKV